MENASKALFMAAEVLVGILLLSLMATLFYIFNNYQDEVHNNQQAKEINSFNVQFEAYYGKAVNEEILLTPHDVLTIYNLVKDYNSQFENQNNADAITIKGAISNNSNMDNFIKNSLTKDDKYIIKNMDYSKTGRVKEITIIKK